MTIANSLKAAKQYLADSHDSAKTRLICHALQKAVNMGVITYNDCSEASKFIIRTLRADGFRDKAGFQVHTVEGWLRAQKLISDEWVNKSYNYSNELLTEIQLYRHRWVDQLIMELS
jgi:hypothetical protein